MRPSRGQDGALSGSDEPPTRTSARGWRGSVKIAHRLASLVDEACCVCSDANFIGASHRGNFSEKCGSEVRFWRLSAAVRSRGPLMHKCGSSCHLKSCRRWTWRRGISSASSWTARTCGSAKSGGLPTAEHDASSLARTRARRSREGGAEARWTMGECRRWGARVGTLPGLRFLHGRRRQTYRSLLVGVSVRRRRSGRPGLESATIGESSWRAQRVGVGVPRRNVRL